MSVHLTKEEMENLKKDALQAGINEGYIVDAEVIEDNVSEEDQETEDEPIRQAQ